MHHAFAVAAVKILTLCAVHSAARVPNIATVEYETTTIRAHDVTIVVERPRAWTCGAPRPLANDAVQTVRECEWR